MKKTCSRILAMLLVLVMAIGMLPFSAMAATDENCNGYTFVFQRNTNRTTYYQAAALDQNGAYTGALTEISNPAQSDGWRYTFILEDTGSTIQHSRNDYHVYRVYLQTAGGTKLYLTVSGYENFSLTATQSSAHTFVLYKTDGKTLLLSATNKHAVEFKESGTPRGLEWCQERWFACWNAYDLKTQGQLKPPATYTVTYDGNGGTRADGNATLSFTYDEGSNYTVATGDQGFTRAGYTFGGWYTEAACVTPAPETVKITGNVTFYAKWNPVTYKITWVDYDGSTIKTAYGIAYGSFAEDVAALAPSNPTRAADAQYTYTFAGWTPEYDTVTGNQTYTATYTETLNTYTVTWMNGETQLEKDEAVEYGTAPSYDGAEPAKEATAQYTYTFLGWNSDPDATTALDTLPTVTEDVTYYAIFSAATNTYSVTWRDWNGDAFKSIGNVPYGTTAEEVAALAPANPTRAADAQYTYTFAGWTPAYDTVTGNQTYTATYTETTNTYTVIWLDWDDSVLKEVPGVAYGTTAEDVAALAPENPSRAANAQYSYSFAGWNPAPYADVTGNQTYKAHYTQTVNAYTVTWKDWDGTELKSQRFGYGTDADTVSSYAPENPSRAATAQYTYTFAGWTPEYDRVTGNQTYTATYTETANAYTVTWMNGETQLEKDEAVEYGATPSYDGEEPTKAATAQYTYTFLGWNSDPDATSALATLPTVTEDATYYAIFSATARTYSVTWRDWNGDAFKSIGNVPYGTTATEVAALAPSNPTRADDADYTYTFAGWTPAYADVTGNQTYTATYAATPLADYTVRYVAYSIALDHYEEIASPLYGRAAVGTELALASVQKDIQGYRYSHSDPAQLVVNRVNNVFTLYYDRIMPDTYTVTYDLNGGTVQHGTFTYRDEDVVFRFLIYGDPTPTIANPVREGYTFLGWTPAVQERVTGNARYTALWRNDASGVPTRLNGEDHYAYVVGYPDGTVRPEAKITRAEVASIFFRLLNDTERRAYLTKYNNFTDVATNDWYCTAVSTLSSMGIISGDPDGRFRPDDFITRAEFAAIAARFDEHSYSRYTRFTDTLGHWAELYIGIAANNGWVSGYPDGTFRPDQFITRAEAMSLVNRVLERKPEFPSDLLAGMNVFTDNTDPNAWYYLDVQEAANSHDYRRKVNDYETWTALRADPDWKALEQ